MASFFFLINIFNIFYSLSCTAAFSLERKTLTVPTAGTTQAQTLQVQPNYYFEWSMYRKVKKTVTTGLKYICGQSYV